MVLDEAWHRLDAVEALSGPHGGPLRRTVKLILDPLVIRPVQFPECAGSILSADGAVLLTARVNAAADVLRATAAWFTLLKQVRRALRITDGNAQDLYFQRCFELATVSGMPDAVRDRGAAEDALLEIHNLTAGRTTQALKDYLADPVRAAELTELIGTAWRRRPLTTTPDHAPVLADLLDACAAGRLGESGPEIDVDDLTAASIGTHHGIRLWFLETDQDEQDGPELPTAQRLGLTVHPLPPPPRVGESASKASLGLPFDRTIHERVFTVLQAASERANLPPIPELVDAEIARSCAPWALLDESLRVTAAAGAQLAVQLRPIINAHNGIGDVVAGNGHRSHGTAADTSPAAARVINNRWQREAYVLQARRMMVRDEPLPVDLPGFAGTLGAGVSEPAGEPAAIGPLGLIAADLRVPWRPYLRRLWARVHGRDVRELPVYELDELWDLLDGVARSVMLDHRMRVKKALAATAMAAELDEMESRAG
ncbi:hypothetical protein [Nocardia acidivorans]|uniref:hypothetical protein n=1 Tax=Nocardia acidivorans TaxID=404580 RepID=UPI00082DBDBC|nr:hypothetical protein [Nocardia acidivorans]